MATKSAQAYPLQWPKGTPRTKTRLHSRFGARSILVALSALKLELSRLNATYIVISTNVPLKVNGDPYSDPGKLPDPGCAVYFRLNDKPYCLPCDRWSLVEENMSAVAKHVEAMRGMERWGVGSIEQTFAGFKQLVAETSGVSWWKTLQIAADATESAIEASYRVLAKQYHPDSPTGSQDAMATLNLARDQGLGVARQRSVR